MFSKGFPPAPEGCGVSAPVYTKYPYFVRTCLGVNGGYWYLGKHNGNGSSFRLEKFGTNLDAALKALETVTDETYT